MMPSSHAGGITMDKQFSYLGANGTSHTFKLPHKESLFYDDGFQPYLMKVRAQLKKTSLRSINYDESVSRFVHVMRYLSPFFAKRDAGQMHCDVELIHAPLKAHEMAKNSDTIKNAYGAHAMFTASGRRETALVVITGDRLFYHQLSGVVRPLGDTVNGDDIFLDDSEQLRLQFFIKRLNMHASPHVLFLLSLGKTVEADVSEVATLLWNKLFRDSDAVAKGLVGPEDISPGIVLRPHVDGELFDDYERHDAHGKQDYDPHKGTDLFDVNANQQFLYVRKNQASKRAYGQNYTVEDHINVRLVSASQDEQDEHVYGLHKSTDLVIIVLAPWFQELMALLKRSQQLKSLAFFNTENAASAIRLRNVLLQDNVNPADEVQKDSETNNNESLPEKELFGCCREKKSVNSKMGRQSAGPGRLLARQVRERQ